MSSIERPETNESTFPIKEEKEICEQRKEAEYLSEEDISEEDMERLLGETEQETSVDEEKTEMDSRHLPRNDGEWEGERGDSLWIPDDEKVPGKSNPEEKTWAEIKDEYNIEGIQFCGKEPDFSDVSRGEVKIQEFSDNRDKNFTKADEALALERGYNPSDVKEWRQENKYTWHECNDCETMEKVPSIVHNNVVHSGGISEKKQEMKLEMDEKRWLNW